MLENPNACVPYIELSMRSIQLEVHWPNLTIFMMRLLDVQIKSRLSKFACSKIRKNNNNYKIKNIKIIKK